MTEIERLRFLTVISSIIGAMPAGSLGTREPEYQALKIIDNEIEHVEGRMAAEAANGELERKPKEE